MPLGDRQARSWQPTMNSTSIYHGDSRIEIEVNRYTEFGTRQCNTIQYETSYHDVRYKYS
jgi:hypothetical protein